jgi:hypothetical protein
VSRLGRRTPTDWVHVERYPLRALALPVPPLGRVNLGLPWWWRSHDQGEEGSCVGHGSSAMMSITNHRQRLLATGKAVTYRYDSVWLYEQAQLVDEWADTPPEEGTSVRASCRVLRDVGHRRVQRGVTGDPLAAHGISTYRWATTVDEIRAAIHTGLAVSIGVNWYANFDDPVLYPNGRWIGRGSLGNIRGGHCVCLFAYNDKAEGFKLMNSWGQWYPPAWVTYETMARLLVEDGEAAVITDR